jgi:DNA-binding CsgD family transcriptional regulator
MRVRSARFVGRERELALLAGWLDEAAEGKPRVVIVGGEAGVGKSRLVEELGHDVRRREYGWLLGAAADYGAGGLPYGALVGALRPVVGAADAPLLARLGPARNELARLFPRLAGGRRPGADADTADIDDLSQVRLLESLLRLLELVSAERPTVLVLEDLHWADTSTRDFLAFLARNLGTTPLLVVGTYRSDDVGRSHPLRRYLAELERIPGTQRIELARLDREQLRQLVASIRGSDVDDAYLEQLYARSQGNAYFSEELLAATGGEGGHARRTLPDTLRDILLARVEELAAETREVLVAAAVIGTADERLLPAVTGMAGPDVSRAIRDAIDRSVLEPAAADAGAGGDGAGYTFRHALAREAIYGDLLAGERRRLHERVAQALSADDPSGEAADAQALARLAYHWHHAGRASETFIYSWRAGQAAERAHANAEASLHYQRVLDHWDAERGGAAGDVPDRLEVALHAGATALSAGDHGRATALLRAASDWVDADESPDRVARLNITLMWSLVWGDAADAASAVRDRLAQMLPACSPAGRIEVYNGLMGFAEHYGTQLQALDLARLALAEIGPSGSLRARSRFHSHAGRARAFTESLEAGLAELELARSLGIEAGDDELVGVADKDIGIVLQSEGRFAEAITAFERSQQRLAALGMTNVTRHTDAEIGFALHRLGRPQEAEAALARALTPPANEWALVVRAYVLVATGRLDEADDALRRAWPSVENAQATTSYGPYYAALAAKAVWERRLEDGLAAAEEGIPLAGENYRWICELCGLGTRAAVDIGPPARGRAEALLEQVKGRMEFPLALGSMFSNEIRGWLATSVAELSRLSGTSAVDLWAGTVDHWRRSGRPHDLAYALYRQSEAILGEGGAERAQREAARAPLAEAWSLASAAGSRLLVGEIEALGRRARIDVGPAAGTRGSGDAQPSADAYGLTARERDVLALLARGRSDQQIAEELFISPKTASVHVSNIKAKLGVEHRIEAAAIGAGLVGAGPDEAASET